MKPRPRIGRPPLPEDEVRRRLKAVRDTGSIWKAARALGLAYGVIRHTVRTYGRSGR